MKRLVRVTQKGLRTILHYAELREKSELVEDLQSKLNQETCEVLVHQKCQRDFTDAKRLRTENLWLLLQREKVWSILLEKGLFHMW